MLLRSKLTYLYILYHLIYNLYIFRIKLAQITNTYTDESIDNYIRDCADILGISSKIENKSDAKAIISYVFNELAAYKKFNP